LTIPLQQLQQQQHQQQQQYFYITILSKLQRCWNVNVAKCDFFVTTYSDLVYAERFFIAQRFFFCSTVFHF